jgi:hypothetical protein
MGRRNFTGWDEWLYVDLTCRGLVGFPHSNRPLALLFVLPAPWLGSSPFDGFHNLHAAYLAASGLLVFALARRIVPGIVLPWFAGLLAAVWAPTDSMRLATVLTSVAVSELFAAVVVAWLLVESWLRQSRWLLLASSLLAVAAIRSYEPTAVMLLGAPLLLLVVPGGGRSRLLAWLAVFGAGLAVGGLFALIAPHGSEPGQLYQQAAGLDPRPLSVALRLGLQLRALLTPAFELAPPAGPTVPIAVAATLALLAGGCIGWPQDATTGARPARLLRVALVAAAWAALGMVPFSLSAVFVPGGRSQFLSAPGLGLCAAALFGLATVRIGRRLRAVLVASVAAWLVFVTGARTVGMQRDWQVQSTWHRQRALLQQLVSLAPAVRPGTLLILADQSGAFQSTFAFRHAVAHLYEGRARGWVIGAEDLDLFYPTRLAADGIHAGVWPMHESAWGERPRIYGYDETLVVWVDTHGAVRLLANWPGGLLPPLPASARYDPRSRVLAGAPSRRARRLLADVS